MAPRVIHFIRHAQGYHNLSIEAHKIRDPLLTPYGEQQCKRLAEEIGNGIGIHSIDCIVASPIRRTLYTALHTFGPLLAAKPDFKIIALPDLQETSALPCDVGSSLGALKQEFKDRPVDFSHVHEGWNNKQSGPFAPRADLVAKRSRNARKFLQSRAEDSVAAVTHGGLLHFLTEDWAGHAKFCGTGWANCELRTYQFDNSSPTTIANATIIETPWSCQRRSDKLQPLTLDEQLELAAVAQRSWAEDGYITLPENMLFDKSDPEASHATAVTSHSAEAIPRHDTKEMDVAVQTRAHL
ncbi:phosphoglycerate mutase-like protein [Lindgomyces ingoldianus]|uniref:Phosphoglycerate mutase-like protein n=1 Tax=Lindgomyces ingoldianus TaxID=673940 RepID=A0ACB6QNS2_9PLEO|nr:phosphoglycerate mutase-like protein [Lindgomyces ingoldianus]KAF2468525.1 phosphoglycerate mutase-like protein [Lindgomyces ingoldianus]